MRYFFSSVGPELFEELSSLFTDLLHQAGLPPQRSTFPGDPPERGVSISHDIMLHQARSRMRCSQVTDTCYQPAPRPCPAQAEGKEGCDCTHPACATACRRATPLDPEARFIHYAGSNKYADLPTFSPMRGRDVYKFAVQKMTFLLEDGMKNCKLSVDDIDLVVPHQVNQRIIESATSRLNFPLEKVYINIDRYGNTSGASIPLAVDEARKEGRIQDGSTVMLVAFGAGLTWAGAVLKM